MSKLLDGTDFKFPGQVGLYNGKVRDVYDFGDKLIFVATDRYSAFDRNLALVKNKGALVTAISKWWFKKTESIVKNHVLSYPDPNVTEGNKCSVIPLEVVVRGYITGVTSTSLWHNYLNGQRDFGSFSLPDGLKKNDRLPEPVLTPTTKSNVHDRPLTTNEVVSEGIINANLWREVQEIAMELFTFGQKISLEKGLILVDTKYEFGTDKNGELVLIDEIHTPDSSRYWRADTYKDNIKANEEPDNYDKEFLRLWYKSQGDPYKNESLPDPSAEILDELSDRYKYVFEQLSSQKFTEPISGDIAKRIETNIIKALENA